MGEIYFRTSNGCIYYGDCLDYLSKLDCGSVNLVVTSPPYALMKKKQYGNEKSSEYLDWFRPFAREIYRVLADNGSFCIKYWRFTE